MQIKEIQNRDWAGWVGTTARKRRVRGTIGAHWGPRTRTEEGGAGEVEDDGGVRGGGGEAAGGGEDPLPEPRGEVVVLVERRHPLPAAPPAPRVGGR